MIELRFSLSFGTKIGDVLPNQSLSLVLKNISLKAKFHYAFQPANSSRAGSRAGLRPAGELLASWIA